MIKKKRLGFLLTQGTRFSNSMKLLAGQLSTKVGYKVLRSTKESAKRKQFKYGQGSNKLHQYRWFEEQGIPALEFTTDMAVAQNWMADGHVIVGRSLLNSSCGKGIHIMSAEIAEVWACPVYTKYKKKAREFRVHVFKDKVVVVVEKKRKKGFEGKRDTRVRNLANGYVFMQNTANLPEGLKELAIKAANVVQSDFKGVDIGYNVKNDELFVIEVNSAPGIVGNNVAAYVKTIEEFVNA